jgi:putative membrane protein
VGLYAFPVAELLLKRKYCSLNLAISYGLFFIMSIAAAYEIIEWLYAVIAGGPAGVEFLGSQGDIWDAQKDMLLDTLGAVTSLILFFFYRPDRNTI